MLSIVKNHSKIVIVRSVITFLTKNYTLSFQLLTVMCDCNLNILSVFGWFGLNKTGHLKGHGPVCFSLNNENTLNPTNEVAVDQQIKWVIK